MIKATIQGLIAPLFAAHNLVFAVHTYTKGYTYLSIVILAGAISMISLIIENIIRENKR